MTPFVLRVLKNADSTTHSAEVNLVQNTSVNDSSKFTPGILITDRRGAIIRLPNSYVCRTFMSITDLLGLSLTFQQ